MPWGKTEGSKVPVPYDEEFWDKQQERKYRGVEGWKDCDPYLPHFRKPYESIALEIAQITPLVP